MSTDASCAAGKLEGAADQRKGASLEEVSAAVGHSSPEVTKRYYDHFVRQSFSPGLREGLGITPPNDSAKVVQMGARRRSKG